MSSDASDGLPAGSGSSVAPSTEAGSGVEGQRPPVYVGRHAALYDLFYEEKPYAFEAERVAELLALDGPGRVLDVACGTGRHATEMAKLGHRVTAIDISWDMVMVARRKAIEEEVSVSVASQDMRSLAF